mgnify:CR=1 FL=1
MNCKTIAVAAGLSIALNTTPLLAAGAQYRVTFDATWSEQTHPTVFPENPHFSGLVGGTHNASVQFWTPGETSSSGIERMAELGQKSVLLDEVNAAVTAGAAFSTVDGPGIVPSPNTAFTDFSMHSRFPLATVVTMIAPSPDWFVGVRGQQLHENGVWLDNVVVDLLPYDAGTDNGVSFTSPDDNTFPRQPIAQITGFPFQNAPPLGTFTFTLLSATVPGDFDGDGDVDQTDFGHFQRCLTGPSTVQDDPTCIEALLDEDNDVDLDDFGLFQSCMSGPDVPGNVDCAAH